MNILWSLTMVALLSGTGAFQLGEIEGRLVLSVTSMVEGFLTPVHTVRRDIEEIYVLAKSNYKSKGFQMLKPADCLALDNSTQVAFSLAVNATNITIKSAETIASMLNQIINCPSQSILPSTVIECVYDEAILVRKEVLDTEAKLAPYQDEAIKLYTQMLKEIRDCLGSW